MPPTMELEQETTGQPHSPFQYRELRAEDKIKLPEQISKHKATLVNKSAKPIKQ